MDLEIEAKLIANARKNPEAFGVLFDEYYPKILNYLVRRTGEVALSEDLCSQAFEKAYTKLWQFQFRSLPFSAWLYRIAGNELKMHYRSKRVVSLESMMEGKGFDVPDAVDVLQELLDAEETVQKQKQFLGVQQKLQTLPLVYQEVIALRFFEEKSILEIAKILGKKEGTVKSLLSRGLEKLRFLQPF